MVIKYWYTLFFLLVFFVKTNAQNPVSIFNYRNSFYFNPAMAGLDKERRLTLNYRHYADEKHGLFSYEHPSKNLNHNIGLFFKTIVDDRWATNNIGLAYNYTFKISDRSKLITGFQFSQFYISGRYAASSLIERDWMMIPNMDFGLVFAIDNFKIGTSIFNLWRPVEKINDQNFSKRRPFWLRTINFNLSLSYDIKIHRNIDMNLSYLYHRISKSDASSDFAGEVVLFKTFIMGGAWRVVEDDTFRNVFLGIQRWDYFTFQISLEITKEDRKNVELILQYDL